MTKLIIGIFKRVQEDKICLIGNDLNDRLVGEYKAIYIFQFFLYGPHKNSLLDTPTYLQY